MATDTTTDAVTGDGEVVGTVPYMSPEQLQGRPIDFRSDVFSLGIVLYEMLTGHRPFAGSSSADVISSILRDTPSKVTEVRADLPRHLGRIIRHCLETEPARRYQTTMDVRNDLEDLRREVDSGEVAAAVIPPAASTEVTRSYRTPMVGRDDEHAELSALLEHARNGQGSLVMIGGEPGVGKTRLAWQIYNDARDRGFLSLICHCYEMEGSPPLIPWVEILEAVARVAPHETLRELLGDAAPEVAKLLPELRRLFPDMPPPLELPPEESRRFLFKCFREFVVRSGRLQPQLLVLEDLHWADTATLLLLQTLAQHLNEMPVLIVGTYRDVELDVARPLAKTLRHLVRERLAHRIALRRLSQGAVAEMLAELAGQPPPPPLVDAIFTETEGNPFFVEEVYQHLHEQGRLFDADGTWLEHLSIEDLDVPEGVRLVVGRRLDQLYGTSVKKQFLDAFDESGDGTVTYEEFGRKGMWDHVLYMAGYFVSLIGAHKHGRLLGDFTVNTGLVKYGNPDWNAERHDLYEELGIGQVCMVAMKLAELEEEMPDLFVPEMTIGKGKWPSYQTATFGRVGLFIYGEEYPERAIYPGFYADVLYYADRTQNGGTYAGEIKNDPDPEGVSRYIADVQSGATEPLDFVFYVPPGYGGLASGEVPNVEETEDPKKLFTAAFRSGAEVWPGTTPL
jgi:hypothetical protein